MRLETVDKGLRRFSGFTYSTEYDHVTKSKPNFLRKKSKIFIKNIYV